MLLATWVLHVLPPWVMLMVTLSLGIAILQLVVSELREVPNRWFVVPTLFRVKVCMKECMCLTLAMMRCMCPPTALLGRVLSALPRVRNRLLVPETLLVAMCRPVILRTPVVLL